MAGVVTQWNSSSAPCTTDGYLNVAYFMNMVGIPTEGQTVDVNTAPLPMYTNYNGLENALGKLANSTPAAAAASPPSNSGYSHDGSHGTATCTANLYAERRGDMLVLVTSGSHGGTKVSNILDMRYIAAEDLIVTMTGSRGKGTFWDDGNGSASWGNTGQGPGATMPLLSVSSGWNMGVTCSCNADEWHTAKASAYMDAGVSVKSIHGDEVLVDVRARVDIKSESDSG